MGELIARNLLHRPLRTFIGIMAVAVEVALVVLIVGLTSGLLAESAKRIQGIGADIVLQPPAASIFLGFSGSPMPMKIGEKLETLKYVQAVAPGPLQFNSTGGIETVYGNPPDSLREASVDVLHRRSFHAVSGGFVFLHGHDMEGPDDMIVDDWEARAKKLKVGDTYNLLNHDWNVVAVVEHGKGSRIFVPILTLQELVGAREKASIFLLKCTRPEHTDDVTDEIKAIFPGYTIRPLAQLASLLTSTNVPGLEPFIHSMIGLAVSIGLLVIFLTMYTTVVERTRDIGVLKSIGANRAFIIRSLLTESAVL